MKSGSRADPRRRFRRCAAGIGMALLVGVASGQTETPVEIAAHPLDTEATGLTALGGLLWQPVQPGPHRAIVLMHGCGGLFTRDGTINARHRDWAERFAAAGFVVLHVDSFGPRGQRSICGDRARSILPGRERARDAYAALRFLQARADIRADAIALLGWSNGGSAVLSAIAQRSAARPPALRHDFAAAIAFYPGCRALADGRLGWNSAVPLLLLAGELDDWTPARHCERLVARAAGSAIELKVYDGAFHDFDAPDTKLRVRRNVATTASGTATIGTDERARADALQRVPDFIARHIGR